MTYRPRTRSARIRTTVLVTLMLAGLFVHAQDVRVGVLGLFRPHQFALSPLAGSALIVHVGADSVVLEASSGVNIAHISVRGDNVVLTAGTRVLRAAEVTVTSRANGPVDFTLAVPGKIARHYRGALELKPDSRVLTAVVTMDMETAVASVVAAESTVDAPSEALKAWAVAARSYFVAGKGRHRRLPVLFSRVQLLPPAPIALGEPTLGRGCCNPPQLQRVFASAPRPPLRLERRPEQ